MRLLSRQEVDAAKAQERKREIDEGLKLARRVDSLREVQAQEEASLEKFRVETLRRIHIETTEANSALAVLKTEVAKLQKARAEALEPINKELEAVNQAKATLKELSDRLEAKEKEVASLEEYVKGKQKQTEAELARIRIERSMAHDFLYTASEKSKAAETNAKELQERTAKADSEIGLRFRQLEARESAAVNTEARQAARDKQQDQREQDLNKRETVLNDKEGKHIRNKARKTK